MAKFKVTTGEVRIRDRTCISFQFFNVGDGKPLGGLFAVDKQLLGSSFVLDMQGFPEDIYILATPDTEGKG